MNREDSWTYFAENNHVISMYTLLVWFVKNLDIWNYIQGFIQVFDDNHRYYTVIVGNVRT